MAAEKAFCSLCGAMLDIDSDGIYCRDCLWNLLQPELSGPDGFDGDE